MKKFKVNGEYITLPQLLKVENIISSGGEIKYFLEENTVELNAVVVFEKRKKIYPGDKLVITNLNIEYEII